jgi:hypothetical protein
MGIEHVHELTRHSLGAPGRIVPLPGQNAALSSAGEMPRRSENARVARRISAEGKLIRPGRQTSYAEGFVRDGTGDLAVYPVATFSMVGEAVRTK